MLDRIATAGLQDVVEADQIAFDVRVRVVDGVAHSRLRRKIHHDGGLVFPKDAVHQRLVGDGAADKNMFCRRTLCRLFDQREAVFFQRRIVVVVHVVQGDDRAVLQLFEQA